MNEIDIINLLGFSGDALDERPEESMRAGLARLFHAISSGHWIERGRCGHDIGTCCNGPTKGGRTLRRVDRLCPKCEQASRAPWVTLKMRSDWGRWYYTLPWEGLNDYGTQDREKELIIPDRLRVRWPDGTVGDAEVVMVPYRTEVGDMGHVYTVRGEIPKIRVVNNGVESFVDLETVEIDAATFATEAA